VRYGDLFHRAEWEWSTYNFEQADVAEYVAAFDHLEAECTRLLHHGAKTVAPDEKKKPKKGRKAEARVVLDPEKALVLPAYDCLIKAAHRFNVLDARGAISVTERQRYIGRVRALARAVAHAYLDQRKALGFPLLPKNQQAAE
jgi:glycyl-tRNA synthetase alpha chain